MVTHSLLLFFFYCLFDGYICVYQIITIVNSILLYITLRNKYISEEKKRKLPKSTQILMRYIFALTDCKEMWFKTFPASWQEEHNGCHYRRRNCISLRNTRVQLWGLCCLILCFLSTIVCLFLLVIILSVSDYPLFLLVIILSVSDYPLFLLVIILSVSDYPFSFFKLFLLHVLHPTCYSRKISLTSQRGRIEIMTFQTDRWSSVRLRLCSDQPIPYRNCNTYQVTTLIYVSYTTV